MEIRHINTKEDVVLMRMIIVKWERVMFHEGGLEYWKGWDMILRWWGLLWQEVCANHSFLTGEKVAYIGTDTDINEYKSQL